MLQWIIIYNYPSILVSIQVIIYKYPNDHFYLLFQSKLKSINQRGQIATKRIIIIKRSIQDLTKALVRNY